MSDTYVTLQGWVGTDVQHRTASGATVANFRVATTPRLKRKGEWVDGDTTWYSVTAWRGLADNVRDSLRKGDAVIVHGKLRTDVWERTDGQLATTLCIDATMIGPDLNRGTARFERTARTERPETDVDAEVDALNRQPVEDLTDFDSFGNPRDDHDAAPAESPVTTTAA